MSSISKQSALALGTLLTGSRRGWLRDRSHDHGRLGKELGWLLELVVVVVIG